MQEDPFEAYIAKGKIYKYTSLAGAEATIKYGTLRFSCPTDFNDPFDCNMAILDYYKTKESVAEYKEALSLFPASQISRAERRRRLNAMNNPQEFLKLYLHVVKQKIAQSKVTCFSKSYQNTLMWSHYADQHKGVCLEFNADMGPEKILDRGVAMIANVNYDKTERINYNKNKAAAIVDLFTRKSSDWKYEEEVRIIIKDPEIYQKFNREFLSGIIFGCRTTKSDRKIILDLLDVQGYNIGVRKAIKGNFKLRFKKLEE